MPTTFGTVAWPRETSSVTVEPLSTSVPPGGLLLMTSFSGALLSCSFFLTLRPYLSLSSSSLASLYEKPVSCGMVTWSGPLETVSSTSLPLSAFVPASGFWEMTSPFGDVLAGLLDRVGDREAVVLQRALRRRRTPRPRRR